MSLEHRALALPEEEEEEEEEEEDREQCVAVLPMPVTYTEGGRRGSGREEYISCEEGERAKEKENQWRRRRKRIAYKPPSKSTKQASKQTHLLTRCIHEFISFHLSPPPPPSLSFNFFLLPIIHSIHLLLLLLRSHNFTSSFSFSSPPFPPT